MTEERRPDLIQENTGTERKVEVELVRSVKIARLLITGAVIGALIMVIITMVMPIAPDANYTMGQVSGFMALVGAVIGLLLGAVLGLVLTRIARKKHGSGLAVQSDVQ